MKILQILLLVFGLVIFANAQKGVLTGTVYDQNGSVIVKTKVTAINKNGEKFEAVTNDEGVYSLNLPVDKIKSVSDQKITKYKIIVESPNFDKLELENFKFVISSKGRMNLDFALDVFVNINRITIPKDINKRKNNK